MVPTGSQSLWWHRHHHRRYHSSYADVVGIDTTWNALIEHRNLFTLIAFIHSLVDKADKFHTRLHYSKATQIGSSVDKARKNDVIKILLAISAICLLNECVKFLHAPEMVHDQR